VSGQETAKPNRLQLLAHAGFWTRLLQSRLIKVLRGAQAELASAFASLANSASIVSVRVSHLFTRFDVARFCSVRLNPARLNITSHAVKLQGIAASGAGLFGRVMALGLTRHTSGVVLRASGAALGLWLAAQVTGLVGETFVSSQASHTSPAADLRAVSLDRVTTSSITAAAAQWTMIARPTAVFSLSSPETEALGLIHAARRHISGEREDTLIYGQFSGSAAHMQLTIIRNRNDAEPAAAFLIESIRQSARSGLSAEKMTMPSAVATKFGTLETADAMISLADQRRNCLVFRFSESPNPVRISGWLCGASTRPADRQQLACLIDRLHLVGGGEDRELRASFTSAELRRDPRCNPPRLAATGRKASWLDADGKAPALRGGAVSGTVR
jgi:hypothetical protein